MSWPADGQPRFKVSELSYWRSVDVAVLDRAYCHQVVRAFPATVDINGSTVPDNCPPLSERRRLAAELADALNGAR